MGKIFWGLLLLFGWPLALWAQLLPHSVITGTVVHVSDGDTLRLDSGYIIRLLDINTPEVAHEDRPAQAGGAAATQALKALVLGKPVQVQLGARVYDPYERVLGHIFIRQNPTDKTNRWVNGALVLGGFAHTYTFPDNRLYGTELLKLEAQARSAKRGLWALPAWQVRSAEACCARPDVGRFVLVQGKVTGVNHVAERTYLNFGPNWRTDFSVAIDDKNARFFRPEKKTGEKKPKHKKGEPKPAPFSFNNYLGKTVLVRGVARPVNGILVGVTHPEQLEIVQ